MISDRLIAVVRCPDCRGQLGAAPPNREWVCPGCERRFRGDPAGFLDLRPSVAYTEQTKYLDDSLHADARHETVSPPLLSAGLRNDMLRSFLGPSATDTVIDLGCGSGRSLIWNCDLGAYRVGIDVSPFFAREALAEVDLTLGDLRRLPFADATFTKAYALDVFEHLSRDALIDVLKDIARVLSPGGTLFVYSHVRRNAPIAKGLRIINRLAGHLDRIGAINLAEERLRKSDHLNPLADIPDLEAVVRSTGFRVGRITYYTPLLGGLIENILVRLWARVLERRQMRDAGAADVSASRLARTEAKKRIAQRGPTYLVLRGLTMIMKLDLLLFGRIRSGPFFALLVKERAPAGDAGVPEPTVARGTS